MDKLRHMASSPPHRLPPVSGGGNVKVHNPVTRKLRLGPIFFGLVVFVALIQIPMWAVLSLQHHEEHVLPHHGSGGSMDLPERGGSSKNTQNGSNKRRLEYNNSDNTSVEKGRRQQASLLVSLAEESERRFTSILLDVSNNNSSMWGAVYPVGITSSRNQQHYHIDDDKGEELSELSVVTFQTRWHTGLRSFVRTVLPWLHLSQKCNHNSKAVRRHLTFHVLAPTSPLTRALDVWLASPTATTVKKGRVFMFPVGIEKKIVFRLISNEDGRGMLKVSLEHTPIPTSTTSSSTILATISVFMYALRVGDSGGQVVEEERPTTILRPHILWSRLAPQLIEHVYTTVIQRHHPSASSTSNHKDDDAEMLATNIVDHRVLVLGPDVVPLTLPSSLMEHPNPKKQSPRNVRTMKAVFPIVNTIVNDIRRLSESTTKLSDGGESSSSLSDSFVAQIASKIVQHDRNIGTCRILVRDWRVLTSPKAAMKYSSSPADGVKDAFAKLRILSDGLSVAKSPSEYPVLFNLNADRSAADSHEADLKPAALPHPSCFSAPLSTLLSTKTANKLLAALVGTNGNKLSKSTLLDERTSFDKLSIKPASSLNGNTKKLNMGQSSDRNYHPFVDVPGGEATLAGDGSYHGGGSQGIANLEASQFISSHVDPTGPIHADYFKWIQTVVEGRPEATVVTSSSFQQQPLSVSALRLLISLTRSEKLPALFSAEMGVDSIAAGVADFSEYAGGADHPTKLPKWLASYLSQSLGFRAPSPLPDGITTFEGAVNTPKITFNQLLAYFPKQMWASFISDHPGNLALSSQYAGYVDGVHVEWDTFCVRCFGFSTELLHYLRPLEHGVSVFTSNGPAQCFCPGQAHSTQQSLSRVGNFNQRGRDTPLRPLISGPEDESMLHIHISHKDPGSWPSRLSLQGGKDGPTYFIGRAMFEATTLPHNWIGNAKEVDEVWVPTRFSRYVFEKEGFDPAKLVVIPEPIDTQYFSPHSTLPLRLLPSDLDNAGWKHASFPDMSLEVTLQQQREKRRKLLTNFRFLSVFKWEERKDWKALLEAYFTEFTESDPVSLVIVSYKYGDSARSPNAILEDVKRVAARLGVTKAPHVEIISEEVVEGEMVSLYRSADAYVSPTRGEGWGLPISQAMAMGLPTITTNWSGPVDFTSPDNTFLIRLNMLAPVGTTGGVGTPRDGEAPMMWAEPDINHMKMLMRAVFSSPTAAKKVGVAARDFIHRHFSDDVVAEVVKARLRYLREERANVERGSIIKKRAYDLLHQQGGKGHVAMPFGGL